MATIQLDQDVLAVESLIDGHQHDAAFRGLMALKERYGRRPEYRYLQALFDAIFAVRTDADLINEVMALVTEQPDFMEAVALLSFLYNRTGDAVRAEVYAREAVHARNPAAQARARKVLGARPAASVPGEPRSRRRSSAKTKAAHESLEADLAPTQPPDASPTQEPPQPMPPKAAVTKTAVPALAPLPLPDDLRLPSQPPLQFDDAAAVDPLSAAMQEAVARAQTRDEHKRKATPPFPRGQEPSQPPPAPADIVATPAEVIPTIGARRRAETVSAATARAGNENESAETITFSALGLAMPPPPTIPPEALKPQSEQPPRPGRRDMTTRRDLRGSETTTAQAIPALRPATVRPPATQEPERLSLSPNLAIDDTGVGHLRSSRPPPATLPPPEDLADWFKNARQHRVHSAPDQASTSATLLELAERVVEGKTPLISDRVTLDRRGLTIVEQRLEAGRLGRGAAGPERASVTAAAAFLMALLLKDCDGQAADTKAEDGACKVTLPGGATVRPLLVAAAFARSRGPGLLETYDRALGTSRRRRTRASDRSASPTGPAPSRLTTAREISGGLGQRTTERHSYAPTPRDSELTVLRRDLDAGTLATIAAGSPRGPAPREDLHEVAQQFWASSLGRELVGDSRRVGSLTLADVDAIERHAAKSVGPVGFAPPGTPWPWVPNEEQEQLIFAWGAVLGEVLNALYQGTWEVDPGNVEDRQLYRVVLSGGVVAWPMAKVYLRLGRGICHDLSVFVDAAGRVVGRQSLGGGSWP